MREGARVASYNSGVNRSRATAILFAVLALVLAAVFAETRGPRPLPASAPPSVFSADRALAFEREILGGDMPHPVGSAAHDAVRDRLAARFRALGYDVTLQRTFACNAYRVCAPLANVIARAPGDTRGDAVLLAAHYDSVPAGPGATDDGQGMAAVVEVARALRGVATRNPIVFLITDGEESGLLGAEGFVADPNLARGAAAVINVEARGTTGRSYLFETSQRNEWLIRTVAGALPHPVSSSLFFNIYELLPNDTDVTVFRRAGLTALNFANTGRVQHYHTPLDNLEHVDPATTQDKGDHLLAAARALGNAELRQTSRGNAVWFDVLSRALVWWPERWSLWLAVAALLITVVAAGVRGVDDKTRAAEVTVGVLSFFASIIATFAVALGAAWLASLRAAGATWVAQPGPALAAMWLIGAGVTLAVAKRLIPASSFDGLFLGHAICWSVLAVALSVFLPGGSYLAVVPAMTCAIGMVLRATLGLGETALTVAAALSAAIVVFPLAVLLYGTLGRPALPIIAAAVALAATTFSPLVAGAPLHRALVSGFAVAALACIAMANLVPTYRPDLPRQISLRYLDDGAQPRWLSDGISPPLARAASFAPWTFGEWAARPSRFQAAPAPRVGLAPVELRVLADAHGNGRRLRLQVVSPRGAPRVGLIFHAPSLAAVRVNGITPPPPGARYRNLFAPGWQQVGVRGAREMTVELDLLRDEPVDAVVTDISFGLPAQGAALQRARNASVAVPANEGDTTTTLRRKRL